MVDACGYDDSSGEVRGDLQITVVREADGIGNPENGPGIIISGFSGDSGSIPGSLSLSQRIFIANPRPPRKSRRSSSGT